MLRCGAGCQLRAKGRDLLHGKNPATYSCLSEGEEGGSSAITAGVQRFIRLDETAFHPLPCVRPQLPGLIPDVLLVPAGSTRNAG
jgi:hypothetical protein